MDTWTCLNCGQRVLATWDVCTACGASRYPGKEPDPKPESVEPPPFPPQACLRCGGAMQSCGEMRFHEGSRVMPFLFEHVGELFVNREAFDVFRCERCGKVEFFMPATS